MKYISSLLILFYCCITPIAAQGFLKVSGKNIVDAHGTNVLLRGIGLGGWMLQEGYMLRIYKEGQQFRIRERIEALIGSARTKEFYDQWLANHTTKADIDSLKSWGFNSVRLPMHYELYTLPVEKEPVAGAHTWLDKGFAMTDSLLAWCKANEIYLVLDLHAAPGGQGNDLNIADRDPSKASLWDSEANQEKTVALWRKIAARYAGEPAIAAYDIINEPNWGFEDPVNDKNGLKETRNEPLKKLLIDITRAIREVDKNHIVIIEGNGWGNNYNGILDDTLWDDNIVLSFHKYWNYNNQQSIQSILDYRDRLNVPVWLGETGENSNVWFTQAIALLEVNNIGWAWWPLKKLGINNPLQVTSHPGYDSIVAFWNDNAKAPPPPDEAYAALITLAKATNIKQNTIQRDVVDAMIRQPHDDRQFAFGENELKNALTIAAVNFDLGRNGIAYYDKDTANYRVSGVPGVGNRGGVYRNDGVDIYRDSTGGFYVGDIEDGEWLSYTIVVPEAGDYEMSLSFAGGKQQGNVSLLLNNRALKRKVNMPGASVHKWKNAVVGKFTLSKGKHVLRVIAGKGGFDLKSLTLRSGK